MQAFDIKGEPMKDNRETRLTRVEVITENINATLTRLESKIDNIDKKFDTKFDIMEHKIDSKLDKINTRIWFNFYWGVAGIASVLSVLAHALKWIP